MKCLLDTSVFLWSLAAEHKLNPRAKDLLTSPSTELYLSAASSWEIAIKFALGSLPLPKVPSEFLPHVLRYWALRPLNITHENVLHAADLPAQQPDAFALRLPS